MVGGVDWCAWQGGVHGRGWGDVRGRREGTHPTGMHSCYNVGVLFSCNVIFDVLFCGDALTAMPFISELSVTSLSFPNDISFKRHIFTLCYLYATMNTC